MIHEDHTLARLDALSRVMHVGALVLGPGTELEFASPLACELLGGGALPDLQSRWHALKPVVIGDEGHLPEGPAPTRRIANVAFPQGERSLRVETYRLGDRAGAGYVVLVKDRRTVDMLETDLVLASQMRSLAHVYRVLAHDLKAPLNAMQLTLELLADSGAQDSSAAGAQTRERRDRYLGILREEVARLDAILRTMLEQKEPLGSASGLFDLREVIREVARVVVPPARRQRVELDVRLGADPILVKGYRDRLKQALLNLALRGLEAMPDGGRLAIQADAHGAAAVVTVEDSGPALPDGLLEEIYQIHYTTRKSASGIGLYMTRLVVESHGGEIAEEGRPGEGARFKLTLPLQRA